MSIITNDSAGVNHDDQLERIDRLKRDTHAAQIRGDAAERTRLEQQYFAEVEAACMQRDAEAAAWVRGLRLAAEVYCPQVCYHLNDLLASLISEPLAALTRRVSELEDAVVAIECGGTT
ncbi:MAG: hypothetical protein U0791_18440 [Gemmataceae bacterium]